MQYAARTFLFAVLAILSLASVNAAEHTTYYIPDAQGSPIAAMDEQGNLLWRESYAPYGERRVRASGNDAKNAYTGKPEDRDTGLVYMGARWYDPETARFTGIDPQGFMEGNPQSFGRYVYANNSPYVYVDPDGEAPVLAPLLVTLAKEGVGAVFEAITGIPAVFTAKAMAREAAAVGGDLSKKVTKDAVADASQSAGLKEGDKVFRVYGGDSKANGASWTTANPADVNDFRDVAGLPSGFESGATNAGRFVIEGTLIKPDAVVKTRSALPLDGNKGGLVEHIIPNPIGSGAVRVDRVSGANPEF